MSFVLPYRRQRLLLLPLADGQVVPLHRRHRLSVERAVGDPRPSQRGRKQRSARREPLLRLRDFEPDVVLWSGFVGDVSFAEVTREEWQMAIDQVSRQLNRRG